MRQIATPVKIESGLYEDFKILGIRSRVTLQNLVEKCIYRYVKDENFRSDMNNFYVPSLSTSGSISLKAFSDNT